MAARTDNDRSAWLVLIGLLAVGLADPAAAQSNSLFRQSRAQARGALPLPAPTSQPAARDLTFVAGATPLRPPSAADAQGPQPYNPVLLEASAIAVRMPEPQRVRVNDLITIIIREDKRATTDAKTESNKEWDVQSEFRKWFKLDESDRLVPQTFPRGTPGVDFDFKSDWKGEGKVERRDALITRIQARIIDVKPNGNLTLEAKKTIATDDEEQVVTLTGECRSGDVTAQNTVLSTQVADLQIRVDHTGAARDASRRGWLMRFFDFVRPI